jgi:hypothetical protein
MQLLRPAHGHLHARHARLPRTAERGPQPENRNQITKENTMPNDKFKAELETIYRKMWNKVEDCLPDDETEVLACRNGTGLFDLASHSDDRWIGSDGFTIYGITHWMEIVAPEVSQ